MIPIYCDPLRKNTPVYYPDEKRINKKSKPPIKKLAKRNQALREFEFQKK